MFDALAHFFIPRSSNNHKANLIHSSTLFLVVIGFCVFQIVLQFSSFGSRSVLGYAANISPSEVERLTNVQREENGFADLKDDPVLDKAAQSKGEDMLAKQYWAHVAPDGTQPWAFFIRAGYNYEYAGENLARDFPDAQSAVVAWMNSPTHRENMLSANYKDIGIGVVEGQLDGADTTIIVQFFGTRLGSANLVPVKTAASLQTPAPIVQTQAPLVASSKVGSFDVTKYVSLGLVGILILVVAVDGFIINRRRIFRIAGHFPAHIAFLGMIFVIIVLAKLGKII